MLDVSLPEPMVGVTMTVVAKVEVTVEPAASVVLVTQVIKYHEKKKKMGLYAW